jgi:hypothetical protein
LWRLPGDRILKTEMMQERTTKDIEMLSGEEI